MGASLFIQNKAIVNLVIDGVIPHKNQMDHLCIVAENNQL